jgi:hypothetical protein
VGDEVRFPVPLLRGAAEDLARIADALDELEVSGAQGTDLGPPVVGSAVTSLRTGWRARRAQLRQDTAFLAASCDAAASAAAALDGSIVTGDAT